MDERSAVFSELADRIIVDGAYKVTKYLSDKLTIKATRKKFKAYKGNPPKNALIEIVFTVGKLNYEEREQIKRAKRDGKTLDTIVKFPALIRVTASRI
jgi:hypothetical protein